MSFVFTIFIVLASVIMPTAVMEQEQPGGRVLAPGMLITDTLRHAPIQRDSIQPEIPLSRAYVIQDPRIDYLLEAHREAMQAQRGIPGYRVHLFMDSGNRARLNAQRERAEFEEKFANIRAYVVYEAPYFKLRVGDFRTRLDARRFLEVVRRQYPGAYIVRDLINFPDLETGY